MLDLATLIEGHPDNVAASLYGGFVASYVNHSVLFQECVVKGLKALKGLDEIPTFVQCIPLPLCKGWG